MMDYAEANSLVQQLATGFETLQDEYQKLFGRHQALQRKLATAREQYNELAKLYAAGGSATTPPLSLSSAHGSRHEAAASPAAYDIVAQKADEASQSAARQIRLGFCASQRLRPGLPKPSAADADGVKIWSGPSADPQPMCMMPPISESPLEQDFTVEGTPSKLGCPFASMAGKKLSSHAASVLSRYKSGGSVAGQASSTPLSSVSRINGRDSYVSQNMSRRASLADPIKAEICGVSDHGDAPSKEPPKVQDVEAHVEASAEAGVCPIRFLNQHSPEEVATYFENHKHELPRSHEVCVKRYQANEAQIRELDSKYGNLVSMIQGLGAKHQPMLPPEPEEGAEDDEGTGLTGEEAEKVRKWASSVSQDPDALSTAAQGGNAQRLEADTVDSDAGRGRQQHFAKPLRDIRVGESPSRPWGISVPARYLEKVAGNASDASSQPARIPSSQVHIPPPADSKPAALNEPAPKKASCPFGFDQGAKSAFVSEVSPKHQPEISDGVETFGTEPLKQSAHTKTASNVAFIAAGAEHRAGEDVQGKVEAASKDRQMVFTGPVFIGYSAEDAAKILKESGLGR